LKKNKRPECGLVRSGVRICRFPRKKGNLQRLLKNLQREDFFLNTILQQVPAII